MKYFVQFIVSLCITICIGYKALAHQNTTSSQANLQELINRLYEDTKSFSTSVDQSDNAQCRTHTIEEFQTTDLFEFYGDMSLVDITVGQYERQGYNVRALTRFNPALTKILAIEDRITSDTSLEDLDLMRQTLEKLEQEWISCLENR